MQALNFFLLHPLRIKVYLKVYWHHPYYWLHGNYNYFRYKYRWLFCLLGISSCRTANGPLYRLQGHQLGAILHQYFTLSSQSIPRWKSHGRDVSPLHPAACPRSSYSSTPCPSFGAIARSYLAQPFQQGHGEIVTVTLRILKQPYLYILETFSSLI